MHLRTFPRTSYREYARTRYGIVIKTWKGSAGRRVRGAAALPVCSLAVGAGTARSSTQRSRPSSDDHHRRDGAAAGAPAGAPSVASTPASQASEIGPLHLATQIEIEPSRSVRARLARWSVRPRGSLIGRRDPDPTPFGITTVHSLGVGKRIFDSPTGGLSYSRLRCFRYPGCIAFDFLNDPVSVRR